MTCLVLLLASASAKSLNAYFSVAIADFTNILKK